MARFLKGLAALFAVLQWLIGFVRNQERVKLEREAEQLADAMRQDFDAIANDGRSYESVADRLRSRAKANNRDMPKPPATD